MPKSGLPSPLTSPTPPATDHVLSRESTCGWKVPLPLPSSTLTELSKAFVGDQVGLAVAVEVRHRHEVG